MKVLPYQEPSTGLTRGASPQKQLKGKNAQYPRQCANSQQFIAVFIYVGTGEFSKKNVCWKFSFIPLQIHIITQTLVYKSCLFCQNGGAYNKKRA
jgi:hypothetical protein